MNAISEVLTGRLTVTTARRALMVTAGVAGSALAMVAAAHVRVPLPFSPVPVTLQTMVVLLAGALLGPGAGAAGQVLYLALGAAGLPVFTTGASIGITGGYLIGFVVAAALVGRAARCPRPQFPVLVAMIVGNAAILALGATWLALLTGMKPGAALAAGVLPFLPGDAMKLVAAYLLWRVGHGTWARLTTE